MSNGYTSFEQTAKDVVLAVDFNFYGTRMATASADHKIRVYDKKDENWVVVDSFGAHDAEITEVKWNGPFMGEVFGSIGEDGRFKLWAEDVTEMPMSGRRFSNIYRLASETRVPFMSMDFKNIYTDTFVALATRDGYLLVLEPVDHENLTHWQIMSSRYLCATPDRQDETSFKVSFHREKMPGWAAVRAGLDRKALSLAVAAMNTVKIFRTDKDRKFYHVADLKDARDLVRDVAWANGSMRGWDLIATASKDGCIRLYELHPQGGDSSGFTSNETLAMERSPNANSQDRRGQNAPSGIGAGLAGTSSDRDRGRESEPAPGRIKETATKIEEINLHKGAIWKVAFSQDGQVLASTGDDGAVRTWKRALDGRWHEYAEVEVPGE